jgi:hypothetical protein
MLHERPGNEFHWKVKLEQMSGLPAETFNKQAAWERLHQRMHEKNTSKKTVSYWAAASSVVLCLTVSWFFFIHKNKSSLIKNNSVYIQTKSSSSHSPTAVKDTSVVISFISNGKTSLPALVAKGDKINSGHQDKIKRFNSLRPRTEKNELIDEKVTNNALTRVNTTQINIVSDLHEKKKLKVVHINELEDPSTEPAAMARIYEHRYELKLINRQVYTNFPSGGNTGFNIFKTQSTPSN